MKRAGFTLAELLIALTLTAFAMTIVAEGVRRSLDFQARINAARNEREIMQAGLAAFRSRVERLLPVTPPDTEFLAPTGEAVDAVETSQAEEDQSPTILFIGQPAQMRFVATDPGYPSTPGLYEYRISVASTDDDANNSEPLNQLVLARRPMLDLETFGEARAGQEDWVLLTTSAMPEFSYSENGSAWQGNWSSRDNYPAFIQLEFGSESQPPLIVPLAHAAPIAGEGDDAGSAVTQ